VTTASGAPGPMSLVPHDGSVGIADRRLEEGEGAAVAELPEGERSMTTAGLAAWRISLDPRVDEPSALPLKSLVAMPPLADPFLAGIGGGGAALPPAPRAEVSTLAIVSVVALLLGPLGAVAAIVFGWAARREIDDAPSRRSGYGLATAGLALGLVLTLGWGAALALGAWTWTYERGALASAEEPEATAASAPQEQEAALAAPESGQPGPRGNVPQRTTLRHIGGLTVVDVGMEVRTLGEELARQRAAAFGLGEKLLVMTTRDTCERCRGVDRALSHPLLQTALRGVRLVRVDSDVFREDLDELKISYEQTPGFFLPSLDLTPQDGIYGGEWDEDVPESIAPVLGAFVRGKHGSRRQPWKPLPGSGVRL